jgi:cyclase
MIRLPRIIPILQLSKRQFIKTIRFRKRTYVGDPMNILRIFNDKEADELVILDIDAHRSGRGPDTDYIKQVAAECFMPITYGGGITRLKQADELFAAGVDKICLNTSAATQPELITSVADKYGAQAVVVSIDVRKKLFGTYTAVIQGATRNVRLKLTDYVHRCQEQGCGEILVNSVDRDGTMSGYDLDLLATVAQHSSVPVVACGGAATNSDLHSAIKDAEVAAAAAGSMFVFQGPHRAVLISYPKRHKLEAIFNEYDSAVA